MMSKIIGLLLIVAALGLGYVGVAQVSKSSKSIDIAGINIDASNKAKRNEGYLFVGLGVLVLIGGIYTFNRK